MVVLIFLLILLRVNGEEISMCRMDQMEKHFGECVGNSRILSFTAKPHENCEVFQPVTTLCARDGNLLKKKNKSSNIIDCTKEDLIVSYGTCVNGRRDIIFYLPDTCSDELYKEPPPLRNQTCNFLCKEGEYFEIDESERKCQVCPKGSTPEDRGLEFSNWYVFFFIIYD
jgi:hypothetical protein